MTTTLDTRNYWEVMRDLEWYRDLMQQMRIWEANQYHERNAPKYAYWQSAAIGLASKGLPL